MKLTKDELEKFGKPARALLAQLVGRVAATLFLEDAEGRELVLHARHRRGGVVVKAWIGFVLSRGVLAEPYDGETFAELAVRCLARVTRERLAIARAEVVRAETGLEAAMRERLARRDARDRRDRAARARKPRFFERLLRFVHLL